MGYFEDIDKNDLNLLTDGKVRYVNGGFTLVPWMESTDDEIYKKMFRRFIKIRLERL